MHRSSRIALVLAALSAAAALAELPAEKIPNVASIPTPYPDHYALVHDFAFGSLIDSSFALVDTDTRRFKGMLSAGQFATVNFSSQRQEFYVGETIHSRGTRGERIDTVAIYDFANLKLQAEIDLPPKRMNVVINKSSTGITSDGRFLLVFNMNPATSVSVVDLDKRAFAGEIALPGCSLVYPDSSGGFFTLCGNGGLVSVRLNDAGGEAGRWVSEAFNDIDNDPLSEKAESVDGVWQFVSYGGQVQPIDATGDRPRLLERWWLTTPAERAQNWRPAGWHGKAALDNGLMWVAMTPNGYNGSHKDPAPEVWRYDVNAGQRQARVELRVPALSIGVSSSEAPKLLVVNIEGSLDVYDAVSGAYIHSIHDLGETPYMVHAIN